MGSILTDVRFNECHERQPLLQRCNRDVALFEYHEYQNGSDTPNYRISIIKPIRVSETDTDLGGSVCFTGNR
jgi:hypothetical protein